MGLSRGASGQEAAREAGGRRWGRAALRCASEGRRSAQRPSLSAPPLALPCAGLNVHLDAGTLRPLRAGCQ
jgi:hypothetical protein